MFDVSNEVNGKPFVVGQTVGYLGLGVSLISVFSCGLGVSLISVFSCLSHPTRRGVLSFRMGSQL